MAKDVKFNIRLTIDGKEQIVTASTNVKEFAEQLAIAQTQSTKLRDDLLKVTQVTTSFQNAMSGLQQLTGLMQTYTAANSEQAEVEAKLANNMRNTMGARDEDVQSIKDLCAAQQRLGVIGDEVQMAGAQELATYLEKKSSLEQLIPVMNDMVAQQYGLNATSEAATNIATMLGKVMDGQVGALSRYGYKFDEAQAQILKFGTEEQRAAVLAEVVESSVGGMNESLAKTDAGKAKQAANDFGDLKEQIGAIIAPFESAIIKAGQFSLAINAISTTVGGIRGIYVAVVSATGALKNLTVVTYAQTAAGKVAAAVQFLWAKQLYYGRQAQIAWAFSAKLATVQAIAMRAAILGLMAVTGVGLAFVAVSSIISLFASKTDDATKSMQDAEAEAKRLQEVQNEEVQAGAQAAATLDLQKEKLKNLIDAKKTGKDVSKEEKKIVGELNDAYGETMGYFDSVSRWYDALIANSEDYCRQMVIEAKTRRLANQIAEKEAETHSLIYDESGKKKLYSTKREIGQRQIKRTGNGNAMNALQNSGVNSIEYFEIPGTSELDKVNQQIRDNNAQVKDLQKQMQDAVAEAAKLDFRVKGSATRPATTTTTTTTKNGKNGKEDKQLIENAKTYKDLANNVAYYQQELEKCDITDTERIVTLAKAKKAAEDAVKAFKDMTDAATMPVELNTLDDYDKKLNALRNDRKTASKEQIAQIDAEIERIEAAKQALEDESVAALKDEEIRTYDQLNKKLAYYNRLLKSGDATQREFAQQGINRLNKLQEAWDEALDAMSLPTTTNNLKDIDAAISFYTARQQKEDADQIQKTQAIIDGLTAKKKALQLGIELPNMQREIAEVNALTGHEYKVRIKGFGFDELTKKIRELQKVLNDTQNPVTDSQRKDIEAMIATYEQWRKQSISAFGTFKDGWNGIKGIGSGIESITNALEGNGNAWQTITAFVDGFISIVEGINTVIGIIDLLTVATTAHTVAKGAESAATVTATTAQGVEAATQEAAAAAAIPVIIANKAATASYMELASAMFFAAHAAIPFAGFGIASGFITAAAAMVQAIGLMPFADGAVVSGPTMALIGEYAGASNNPEVVAPLDKLRDMIEPQGAFAGKVRFEIEGRKLVGIIEKEYNHTKRS
jgi:hypothetical protein